MLFLGNTASIAHLYRFVYKYLFLNVICVGILSRIKSYLQLRLPNYRLHENANKTTVINMDSATQLMEPPIQDANKTSYSNIADAKELTKVDESELIS